MVNKKYLRFDACYDIEKKKKEERERWLSCSVTKMNFLWEQKSAR